MSSHGQILISTHKTKTLNCDLCSELFFSVSQSAYSNELFFIPNDPAGLALNRHKLKQHKHHTFSAILCVKFI